MSILRILLLMISILLAVLFGSKQSLSDLDSFVHDVIPIQFLMSEEESIDKNAENVDIYQDNKGNIVITLPEGYSEGGFSD